MLDIRKIKENPDAVKAGLKAKEVDCDAIVDKILELDVQVRGLKTSTETKTAQKNKLSKENGKLFGMKKGLEKKGEDTSAVEAQIAANMAESVKIDEAIASDKVKLKQLEELQYECAEKLTADDYTFLLTWKEESQYDDYRIDKINEFKEEVAAWRRKARRTA